MPNTYYRVEISAETSTQADDILTALLSMKLVTGGQIINAPARFLWKGAIVEMDYYTLTSFTIERHKDAIIAQVKAVSIEEVPMVSFLPMDGNVELLGWIDSTLA